MKHSILFVLVFFLLVGCSKKDEGQAQQSSEDTSIPVLFIDPIINIKGDRADTGGEVLDPGGADIQFKGVCWSTSPNPDINDNKQGSGQGPYHFEVQLAPLEFNTRYYVRSYASNVAGVGYSDEVSFTTTDECTVNIFRDDDVLLTTQSEVDQFGLNNYCGITRDLTIQQAENATSDFIVDLSPLSKLRQINRLSVKDNTHLENLDGLDNLNFIFNSVSIDGNLALENIDALRGVTSPLNSISITENNKLLSIDGLIGIPELIRPPTGNSNLPYLGIIENEMLQNINGLRGIEQVESHTRITIKESNNITHLNGLENIRGTIGSLEIGFLPRLTNIQGVIGIDRLDGELAILNCDALANFNGLSNVSYIGSDIRFFFNDAVQNLDALSNLNEVDGSFQIINNSLSDFCGLQNLFENGGVRSQFITEGNKFNPTRQDIENGNCSL